MSDLQPNRRPESALPPGVTLVDFDQRPAGMVEVTGIQCPDGKIAVREAEPVDIDGIPNARMYATKPVAQDIVKARVEDAFEQKRANFNRMLQQRFGPIAPTEGAEEKRQRDLREADVVEAARRSQAEIRRHVDAYLKEHLEVIAGDIASVILKRATEAVVKGIAGMQEQQMISLDRIASDVRSQMRAFFRGYVEKTPSKARRASGKTSRAKRRPAR